METTTQGRILAVMSKSTTTTSPRLKPVIVHFRGGPKFFPRISHNIVHRRFYLALTFQKIEVVPEFAQHWLRLVFDFFKQNFLCAHD
jgi:hypothetical protein